MQALHIFISFNPENYPWEIGTIIILILQMRSQRHRKVMKLAHHLQIIKLYNYLKDNKNEFILSKQIVRSGTSIGANIREAVRAFSKADFSYKMNIALKESNETEYWLELLYETGYIKENEFQSLYDDCCELSKILTAIVKSSRSYDEK